MKPKGRKVIDKHLKAGKVHKVATKYNRKKQAPLEENWEWKRK